MKLMPWNIIERLEANNSRKAKEAMIRTEAEGGNDIFFEGARLALDPLVTFGIKQVPVSDTDGPGLDWIIFHEAVKHLITREVTGNAARIIIESLQDTATARQWNLWYRRILIKDLRCGVSEKTVNGVVHKDYPSYAVPVFTCQLAHDSANHEKKVQGKKQIEIKLDGVRVLCILYKDKRPEMFSRNGKQFHNFEHIIDELAQVANTLEQDTVLDGEVMSSSFQDLMKQVHRKSNVQSNDAVFHVFDMLSLEQFQSGGTDRSQERRSTELHRWIESHAQQLPHVACLSWEDVDLDTAEGQQRFRDINKQAIDGGYEGIMIKDPSAGYQCKRSHAWLKMKPFIEVSLEVKALEEGTGRNAGKLGALVCEGQDDGKDITTNVGSGLTDDNRDVIWSDQQSVIGQIVEVRADAITQNQDGTYSLRFPRFLRFRGFEVGEKL